MIIISKLRYLLFTLILAITSCNPDEQDDSTGTDTFQSNNEFLTFDDSGSTLYFTRSGALIQALYPYAVEQGFEWYWNGAAFTRTGYNFGDHMFFSICLPIDSSHVGDIEIGTSYFTNDSTFQWTYEPVFPGSILFDQSTDNGSDEEYRDTDTTQFFNRISSISYVGNRRYDQIQELVLCDFLITGTFRMRVINDITDVPRILDNGSYSMVVSLLAE